MFVSVKLLAKYVIVICALHSGTFIIVRHLTTLSVFIWTRNIFFTDTASVHTYPMNRINENGTFRKRSLEWNLLKTLFSRVRADRWKRNFSKTLSRMNFLKTLFSRVRVDRQNGTFRKRWGHTISSHPLRAIIRNLFKMADGSFSFLSFILWLISNLTSCFQANLALLILQADYSRRRQNIIRLLSLPVSRGGRLDLPIVWLCLALILTF